MGYYLFSYAIDVAKMGVYHQDLDKRAGLPNR
jgi:hypothetical protein